TVRALVESNLQMIEDYPYLAGYIMTELHQQPERCEQAVRAVPGCREKIDAKIDAAVASGEIVPTTTAELSANLLSLTLFPAIGKGFVRPLAGLNEAEWDEMMQVRAERVTAFYMRAMRR
ncbi:MAG: hypothetical protein AAF970_07715, partial [Bacteroidota bacterium]